MLTKSPVKRALMLMSESHEDVSGEWSWRKDSTFLGSDYNETGVTYLSPLLVLW